MKKAIALLATLVVLTSTAFAQLAPTLSGSASTYWGADFETGTDGDTATGFENDTDITVTIPLVTDASVMSEGEGAYGYGEITGAYIQLNLEDFSFGDYDDDEAVFDVDGTDVYTDGITGSEGDLSAKIDFGNGAYVVVGDLTGLSSDLAEGDADYWLAPGYDEGEGMTVGYSNDMLSFEFTIANDDDSDGYEVSDGDDAEYTNDTSFIDEDSEDWESLASTSDTYASTTSGYSIGANGSYTAGDIFTLDFEFATTATSELAEASQSTGFAVQVASVVTEGVTVTVPFDYYVQDGKTAMEAFPQLDVAMGAISVGADFHYLTIAKELVNADIDALEDDSEATVYTGTAYDYTEDYTNNTLGVSLGYTLDAGTVAASVDYTLKETMLAGADDAESCEIELSWTGEGYSVTTGLDDVLQETVTEGISFDATYTAIAGLDFSVETAYYTDSEQFDVEELNVDFTSELTGIENTTFTINWSDVEFAENEDLGIFYVGASIAF